MKSFHVSSEEVDRVLDREAPPHEEDLVLEHLGKCRDCAARFGPGFEVVLLAAIPPQAGARRHPAAARVAAAAVVLIGVALSLAFDPKKPQPRRAPAAHTFEVHRCVLTRTERLGDVVVEETWNRVSESSFEVTRVRARPGTRVVETWSVRTGES